MPRFLIPFKLPKHLLLCLAILLFGSLNAQDETQRLSVSALLLDESLSFPVLNPARHPYHPAFQLGLEYKLRSRPNHDFHLGANLGFYFHRYSQTAGFINVQIGLRLRFGRFSGRLGVGPGFALASATQPVYTYSNSSYQEGKDGQLIFMPSLALGLGYRIGSRATSPELLLHYELAIDQPFANFSVPHLFVGAGVRLFPFNR